MKAAELPYATASSALMEIEANAKIRIGFERVIIPNARAFFAAGFGNENERTAFQDLLKLKSADSSANYRGLLILVCTTVEYFCKQVIQNVVRECGDLAKKFSDLSPILVAANFAYTGEYFQKDRAAYASGGARDIFEDLSEGLMTCRSSATSVRLNPKVFTQFLGNCTPTQLEKRFKELGLPDPFGDKIGAFPGLKAHFKGGGVRDVAKLTREELDNLVTRRNGLVHSSTISETVTVDELFDAVAFARALMAGLKYIVEGT